MKIKKRNCNYCGKFYIGTGANYCSRECFFNASKRNIVKKCLACNTEFSVKPSAIKMGYGKFCSKNCCDVFKNHKIELKCEACNSLFKVFESNKNQKFCSRGCYEKSRENSIVLKTCVICNKEYPVYKAYLKKRNSFCCSVDCKSKYSSLRYSGENSFNWRGGISSQNKRIRKNIDWKNWRKSVFERDCYTCCSCGNRSKKDNPVELHPHHIKHYKTHENLRFNINNGLTLCVSCHKSVHSKIIKNDEYGVLALLNDIYIDSLNEKIQL
jgi:hypothetical protein